MKFNCQNCDATIGFEGVCWKCRTEQERNEVLGWTDEQIAVKIQHLIAHADRLVKWDTVEYKDCSKLLELRGIFPPELQRAALAAKAFSMEQLYYHAPVDVRDGLIELLQQTTDAHEANNLMSCLAMQGDERALETLLELELNPAPWSQNLFVDPSIYAQAGGWTFDRTGNRRELNFATCYAMEKGDKSIDKSALIGTSRTDTCPHCKRQLVDILVLDGRDERLSFLEMDGIFTATCCPNCCCYTDAVFSRFTLDGESSAIFPYNELDDEMNEEVIEALSSNSYILRKSPVPLFYGVGSEDINTIGGFASWVQDWQYVNCPDCSKPMKYIAQIRWDTLMDYSEGTLFIEVCTDCHVASMHHQQT